MKIKKEVEVKYGDKWLLTEIQNVRKGQTFRMWTDIDKPVVGERGQTEFLAMTEPFYNNEKGEWMISYDNTDYSEIVN